MADQTSAQNQPAAVIPWYRSPTIVGLLVTLVTQVMVRVHLTPFATPELVQQIVNGILDAVSTAALLYAAKAHASQVTPAVAISQSAADQANAAAGQPSTASTTSNK